MSDVSVESRLDELAAKVALLEEEVVTLSKRIRKLRKRVVTGERGGKDDDQADAADD